MDPDKGRSFCAVFRVLPIFLAIACILSFFLSPPAYAQAGSGSGPVQLVQPVAGSEVIGKKPLIKCSITEPFLKEYLFVYLDGVDVTGIIDVYSDGFSFKPIQVLMSGQHQVHVLLYAMDGREIQQAFAFSVRHSRSFDDLLSVNQLTARYEGRLHKPAAAGIPDSRIDANLASSELVRKGKWGLGMDTNLRFVDQDTAVQAPLYKGLNVSNYLLRLEKTAERDTHFLAELGDVQINESTSTLMNFARRGGKASFTYKSVTVGGFVVKSDPLFGLRSSEDTGLAGHEDTHLKGASGSVALVKDKALVKVIYLSGGSTGNGLGLYTEGGGSEGRLGGAVLQTNFFSQKFITEMEYYDSTYDFDTADALAAADDEAWRFSFNGAAGKYTYHGAYEHFGLYYNIPGQAISNDREGIVLGGGKTMTTSDINLGLSRHRNNVDDSALAPVVYTTVGSLNYNCRKKPTLPVGINYSRTILDTSDEPAGVDPVKIATDVATATFSYLKEGFNLVLQPGYSAQDNRRNDEDSSSTLLSLTASYTKSSKLAVSTGASYTLTEMDITGEETDNYLVNLQLQGRIFGDKLGYGLFTSYNLLKSNIGAKTRTITTDMEVAWSITGHKKVELFNPTIGIRTSYNKTRDYLFNTGDDTLVALLVLTSTVPFTF